MPYTMKDFLVEVLPEMVEELSPQERKEVLKRIPSKERLVGIDAEERVQGLNPQERLQGLTLKQFLEGLNLEGLTPEQVRLIEQLAQRANPGTD